MFLVFSLFSMIIPARWYAGGKGLDEFRDKMIHDHSMRELHDFFDAICDHPKKLLFTVSIFTGMREGEILALTWDCIRFEIGEIYLYRQLSNKNADKEYRFTSLKNGKTRILRPAPFIIKLLKQHHDAVNPDISDFVFKNANGDHYTHAALYNAFQRVMNRLNYKQHLRFHDLRHTFATEAIRAGVDVETVSKALGHFSVGFTLDVYGHVTQEMKEEAARRIMLRNWPNK